MGTRMDAPRGDTWLSALHQLTAEGTLDSQVESEIVLRHEQIAAELQTSSLRSRLEELSGYAGAALILVGLGAAGAQLWEDTGLLIQVAATAAGCALLAIAAAVILLRTDGHRAGLMEHPARRRLVGVLGTASAGLLAATIGLVTSDQAADPHPWLLLVFASALVGSSVTAWAAPGVVPTLAVAGTSATTLIAALDNLGWIDTPAVFGSAFLALALVAGFGLVRLLQPRILVEALAVATWLVAASTMAVDHGTTMWIGRTALLLLAVGGALLFVREGGLSLAVGSAAALAVLIHVSFDEALGGAIGMVVAGVVLVAMSVALSVARRHRGPPG